MAFTPNHEEAVIRYDSVDIGGVAITETADFVLSSLSPVMVQPALCIDTMQHAIETEIRSQASRLGSLERPGIAQWYLDSQRVRAVTLHDAVEELLSTAARTNTLPLDQFAMIRILMGKPDFAAGDTRTPYKPTSLALRFAVAALLSDGQTDAEAIVDRYAGVAIPAVQDHHLHFVEIYPEDTAPSIENMVKIMTRWLATTSPSTMRINREETGVFSELSGVWDFEREIAAMHKHDRRYDYVTVMQVLIWQWLRYKQEDSLLLSGRIPMEQSRVLQGIIILPD